MTQHSLSPAQTRARRARRGTGAAIVAGLALVATAGVASAAVGPVPLGSTESFVVLAGSGVSNTGASTLSGDIGTFPTTTITGAGTLTVNGTNHGGDLVTQGAKDDLVVAYDNAAGQGPTMPIAADLASQTLTSGVYNSGSQVLLSGALTLDGGGDPDAIFVFQAGSDLIFEPGASVVLINGAQACNVFWQVTSSATVGSGATPQGTIMALTSITFGSGATLQGRALARNGTVVLDNTVITAPTCAAVDEDDDTGGTDGSGGSDGTGGTDGSGGTDGTGGTAGEGSDGSASGAAGGDAVGASSTPVGGVQTGKAAIEAPGSGPSPALVGTLIAVAAIALGGVVRSRRHPACA